MKRKSGVTYLLGLFLFFTVFGLSNESNAQGRPGNSNSANNLTQDANITGENDCTRDQMDKLCDILQRCYMAERKSKDYKTSDDVIQSCSCLVACSMRAVYGNCTQPVGIHRLIPDGPNGQKDYERQRFVCGSKVVASKPGIKGPWEFLITVISKERCDAINGKTE